MRKYAMALAAMLLPAGLMGQVMADKTPANAMVYVGFKGTQALAGQYQQSHLRGVVDGTDWNVVLSEKFQQQLAKLMYRDSPELADRLPAIFEAFKAAAPYPSVFWVSAKDNQQPTVALICEAGDAAAAVAEKFKAALPPGGGARVIQSGKFVALADRPEVVELLLKGADAQATLAGVPEFAAAMKQVDAQGAITFFLNTKAMVAELSAKVQQARNRLTATGLDQFQGVAASGNFAGQGWENRAFVLVPGNRSGVAALVQNAPVTEASLKLVPATATRCSISHLDLVRLHDTIRNVAAGVDPDSAREFDQAIKMATNTLGVDLVKQLFPALGDEWVIYTDANVGGQQPMGMVLANRLRDPAKAETLLLMLQNKLLTFARAGMQMKEMTLPASEKQVGGTKVRVISLPLVTPSWAVRDGVLYVGLYPQVVAAAAEFPTSGKPTFAQSPLLAQAQQAAGTMPQSISYFDLPRAADAGYGFALLWSRYMGIADLFGLETPTMPLPTLPTLRPHLAPTMSFSWADAQGWHMRSTEPFPGGEVLGMMMTSDFVAMQGPVTASILLPSLARAREQANRVKCAANMRTIGQGIMLYANDHKAKYPAEIGDVMPIGISVQVFACPSAHAGIPDIVLQSPPDEQAEWVNQNPHYVYVGSELTMRTPNPSDRPVLYEKLDHHHEGANVLFADGHVEFVDRARFQRIIADANKPARK